jgi:aminopeptidase N
VYDVFNNNVYGGGALVLYALQQKIGDAAFARVERAWVHRYAGRSASSADFIALASRVSGQDLTGFLRAWIYGTTTPPMPGHPDWTVAPVVSTPDAAKAAKDTGPSDASTAAKAASELAQRLGNRRR